MNREQQYRLFLIIGLILIIFPVTLQILVDIEMRNHETITFVDDYGNKIFNTYYPGESETIPGNKAHGIMIFHGMGNDQKSLDVYTARFHAFGFHVFTTDFSGHGRSSGVIPSGENSADILANQVLIAKSKFKEKSGLADSEIFMLGHSMGARAVMRATLLDTNPVNGCILIGAAIHIGENETSWTANLNSTNPKTNVLLLSGALEDVLPPTEAIDLYNHLANTTVKNSKTAYIDHVTPENYTKSLRILPCLTHTHEAMSGRAVALAYNWVADMILNTKFIPDFIRSNVLDPVLSIFDVRYLISISEVIGIFLCLIFGQKIIKELQEKQLIRKTEDNQDELEEERAEDEISGPFNLKKFYWFKLLIWVGGFDFAAAIVTLIAIMPFGVPYFTLLFIGPITGYGIMNIILYLTGKTPGYNKKWRPEFKNQFKDYNWWKLVFGIFVAALFAAVVAYLLSGFLYLVFPPNIRLAWLAIFTLFGSLGFYILQIETKELRNTYPNNAKYTSINYALFLLPFIIGVLVILAMGRIIYIVDGVHDLILLGSIILVGDLLQQIWEKPYWTGLVQSFLLFFFLLPRGQMAIIF